MSWITNLFAKHWRNLHFIIIVFLSVLLIIGYVNVNIYLNQFVFSVFYSPFARVQNSIVKLRKVASKNEELNQKLAEISVRISMYDEAVLENKRLRSILGFEPPPGYSLLPAEIISIKGDYLPVSAIINKGSDDSIFIDQPLINQQGLIGRISMVSKNYSTVQLLTDPTNSVAARLKRSREMGIIKYSVQDGLILDIFPIQGDIKTDDTILSSGLGGIYPRGLKVGIVRDVYRPDHEPFCKVKVEPAVNFYSIDELFILREESQ